MLLGLGGNIPGCKERRHRIRSRSPSPSELMSARKNEGLHVGPRPYMKQVKLHPSGCQQWSSQVVAGGGIYMAYASTLSIYVYDVRDYSLVTILGGNECNIHSLLWHPHNPHRLVVFSTNGYGAEWDVRSEERVTEYDVGMPPACSSWDLADASNLVVVSRGSNAAHLLVSYEAHGLGGKRSIYPRRSNTSDPSLEATCAKWSRYKPGMFVVGWTDGRVSFSKASTPTGTVSNGRTKLVFPKEGQGSVIDLRHDPHGGIYLLVAYNSGSVVLWDTEEHHSIASYERCASGLVGVRWMAWAPGNFLTLSSKTGVAKVFNISQSNAIGTVRLGETGSGIRDMAWLPSQTTNTTVPTFVRGTGPRAVCGFRDGSLSVVDTGFSGKEVAAIDSKGDPGGDRRALLWASKAGHVETVFTCTHRPGDANTLATGSYGSSVKVWHTPTMDLKVTLTGQTGAIYSIAWSQDGERIASSSREGTVWIWDAESGKAERRLHLHSQAAHRVQWDPFHPTRLASVGADKRLVIFTDTGEMEKTYEHPAALFGCHWCPSASDIIATGCQDGNVRVFDVSFKGTTKPQYLLSGHSRRVFNVSWSPLLHGTLASGSDDTTIIVWCLGARALQQTEPFGGPSTVRPSAVLHGHTSNVRPLLWNAEVPWLLLSGSWDGTIRAWDIRRAGIGRIDSSARKTDFNHDTKTRQAVGPCIAVMRDHIADVYGLSAADERPFLYVSSSRDTTLRHFTVEGVISSIKTRAIIANSLTGSLGEVQEAMCAGYPSILCGQASRALQAQLHELLPNDPSSLEAPRRLFDYFWSSDGIDEFWEVIRWVVAAACSRLEESSHDTNEKSLAQQRQRLKEQEQCISNGKKWRNFSEEGASHVKSGSRMRLRDVPRGLMLVEARVMHHHARREWAQSLARRLEQSPFFLIQDRRVSRLDCLTRAARLYLAAGDLRSSCEVFIKLGRWESALAVAPAIGMDYWQDLTDRFAKILVAGRLSAEGGDRCGGDDALAGGGSSDAVQQCGVEGALRMTPYLLVSTGRAAEALNFMESSEEAATLAISVADGAFRPRFPSSSRSNSEYIKLRGATPMTTRGQQQVELDQETAVKQTKGESPTHQSEAKLLGLIDEHLNESMVGRPGQLDRLRETCQHVSNVEDKSSSKHGISYCSNGNNCTLRSVEGQIYERRAFATQRESAAMTLRIMTRSSADIFFRASQPALGAATLLSLGEGTRRAMANALSLLVQGEEPDLAYAAARVLRFPERELCSLIREMARRAEAWGDAGLAIELLSEAVGEDRDDDAAVDGNERGERVDCKGYLPAFLYETAGEESGPRAMAMIASRARAMRDMSRTSCIRTSLQSADILGSFLRSESSYLCDAESALDRGKDVEAVQLFVLGGDMERAIRHGIVFLRRTLPSLPRGPSSRLALRRAHRVIRALSSGSPVASAVPKQLLQELLAYANYVGALEANSRRYYPIVGALLQNAVVCVRAAEKLRCKDGSDGRQERELDEKADAENGVPKIEGQDGQLFPACMSAGTLVLAMVRHLMSRVEITREGDLRNDMLGLEGHDNGREVALAMARNLREEEWLSEHDARAVDVLILSAERRARLPTDRGSSPTSIGTASADSEEKHLDGDFPTNTSLTITPGSPMAPGIRCGESASSTTDDALPYCSTAQIVVSGSRLPSCQRYVRLGWRARENTLCDKLSSRVLSGTNSSASAPCEHGQQAWPLARGATFLLEDGESCIGLSNAVMWVKAEMSGRWDIVRTHLEKNMKMPLNSTANASA